MAGGLGQGQEQLEAGALAGQGGIGQQQLPALGVGQPAGDVQPQADPAGQPGRARTSQAKPTAVTVAV